MVADPARALAEHVCRIGFEDLPATTREATRRDILDTFGCMLGGSGSPGISEVAWVLRRWGGIGESRVVLGGRMPAAQAALLNASMGHALDFDDTLDHGGSIHPGVSVLAASLAVADRLGGISGRELMLAVALGLDVSCRIALAATLDRGWHRTAAIGVFGATVAAGKLLALSPPQMEHALGIAYSHAAGNRQCIVDGALTKRLQAGQAAGSAVFAAELAAEGFTGAENIFLGKFGFFELYQPNGYDAALLTYELGVRFRGEELSFKPYPCGRPLHATLDAAVALHKELGLADGATLASIKIATDPATYVDNFENAGHKRKPRQIVEAQFALPFLVAAALVHGRVGIGEVSAIDDAVVLALAARIEGRAVAGAGKSWAQVTVRRADGRHAMIETTSPLGSPENSLGVEKLERKFADCAANAVRPIAPARVAAATAAILDLESMADVGDLLGDIAA